ncbi:hypothetical protein AYWB_201 [Aster yellows witches'-broom phytoplasma AYWB]|uniref:Uncharacterized protein n=1 Tax=Aster yellows witches'-broom phytoplasma (strain AYWB) TaxID=322098 RepID=Q2NJS5_AYWBP|nr:MULTISPECIES: hypothetical protein [16SrI (Aster yellows group)]ABC65318.1 hypothetical protein AYWB_201 [Aster yellows witches'-broom phytoplasma AYWB]
MKRYDINVLDKEDIPNILKYYDISASVYNYIPPSYNLYNDPKIHWYLKNPSKDLLGIYFKPRTNPFKIEYPYGDYNYTLEDLIKYKIAIVKKLLSFGMPNKNLTKINLI